MEMSFLIKKKMSIMEVVVTKLIYAAGESGDSTSPAVLEVNSGNRRSWPGGRDQETKTVRSDLYAGEEGCTWVIG